MFIHSADESRTKCVEGSRIRGSPEIIRRVPHVWYNIRMINFSSFSPCWKDLCVAGWEIWNSWKSFFANEAPHSLLHMKLMFWNGQQQENAEQWRFSSDWKWCSLFSRIFSVQFNAVVMESCSKDDWFQHD